MWRSSSSKGGRNTDNVNDRGQSVQLYVPSLYHGRGLDKTVSTIGGPTMTHDSFVCSFCERPLLQLAHLCKEEGFSQNNKSYVRWTVQACNSFSCFQSLFPTSDQSSSSIRFSVGGGGVVRCVQESAQSATSKSVTEVSFNKEEVADEDYWGFSVKGNGDGEDSDLDYLEKRLVSHELGAINRQEAKKKCDSTKSKTNKSLELYVPSPSDLPWFKITPTREPPPVRQKSAPYYDDEDDVDDDVGLAHNNADYGTDKIQQMLAKYMEEEEDADLVSLLQGGNIASNSSKYIEADERLTADERAFRKFLDRIQRFPKQVLRYIPGGMPIWSVPEPKSAICIPACRECGNELIFQFQIVPQILSVLQVDDHVTTTQKSATTSHMQTNDIKNTQKSTSWDPTSFSSGGMNFGNLAIYSCYREGRNCNNSECVVVVQASIDEGPAIEGEQEWRQLQPASSVDEKGTGNLSGEMEENDDEEGWIPDSELTMY